MSYMTTTLRENFINRFNLFVSTDIKYMDAPRKQEVQITRLRTGLECLAEYYRQQ